MSKNKIKVVNFNSQGIFFDDGTSIQDEHYNDCCENNYADFEQLKDTGIEKETFVLPLIFEAVPGAGFRFGNKDKMYFVPCYSYQNGYYSDTIDIIYDGECVLHHMRCELVVY